MRTLRASPSNMTAVPRWSRICFFVRLIIPCCLPAWVRITLPVPESLKRFLAPELVFNLGISLILLRRVEATGAPRFRSPTCLLFEQSIRHGSP